jgi:hypothetical protein
MSVFETEQHLLRAEIVAIADMSASNASVLRRCGVKLARCGGSPGDRPSRSVNRAVSSTPSFAATNRRTALAVLCLAPPPGAKPAARPIWLAIGKSALSR